ncbi:cytochrome P450 [Diaporthe helianthi]|uniref:Cytochrome P450 n=1 Tax=Diaporthe helianthi TaxID=158607 RepID=A0A2P5IF87_DIAHE|nr:cytochrome P450 [Diaporthe helianthi]
MDWFRRQAEKHRKPLLQLFPRPFGKPFVLLSDFGEIQAMMISRKSTFDRSSLFRDILGGAGEHHHILKKSNKEWQNQRSLLADLMVPAFLHNVAAPHIYTAVHNIIDLWEAKTRISEGRPFRIDMDVDYLALDAVLAFTYGDAYPERAVVSQIEGLEALSNKDILSLRKKAERLGDGAPMDFLPAPIHEDMDAILTMVHMAETLQSSVFPTFTWWWLSKTPKIRNAWARRDGLVSSQIGKAVDRLRENGEDDTWLRNAVDLIVNRVRSFAKKEGKEPSYINPMTLEEVRRISSAIRKWMYRYVLITEQVFGFTMAGQESSSSTLIWALKYLTNHQDVQKKLRSVLHASHKQAFAEKREPSVSEITHTQIPYLDAVMNECLRLGTPIPFLARDAEVDTEILGVPIPKGTTIFAHTLGPSLMTATLDIDPKLRYQTPQGSRTGEWEDEDKSKFRPERWLVESRDPKTGETTVAYDPNAGPLLAFGLGQRACFGRRMGLFEFRNSLTLLIWHFDFLPVPDALATYDARDGLTRRPKAPFVRTRRVVY